MGLVTIPPKWNVQKLRIGLIGIFGGERELDLAWKDRRPETGRKDPFFFEKTEMNVDRAQTSDRSIKPIIVEFPVEVLN